MTRLSECVVVRDVYPDVISVRFVLAPHGLVNATLGKVDSDGRDAASDTCKHEQGPPATWRAGMRRTPAALPGRFSDALFGSLSFLKKDPHAPW